jgi:hypothetical protein
MVSGDHRSVSLLCVLGHILLLGCTPNETDTRIRRALSCGTGNTLQLGSNGEILPWPLQDVGVVSMFAYRKLNGLVGG